MEGTKEFNNNNNRLGVPIQRYKTMREYLHPLKLSTLSCFSMPQNQNHVTIQPQLVSLLPIFRGNEHENPYIHIKDFVQICSTFQEANVPLEIFHMKLFPLTLKD